MADTAERKAKKGRKTGIARKKRSETPIATSLDGAQLSGDVYLKAGRRRVLLTSLDRLYWKQEGITKGDLLKYYWDVSEVILRWLKGRPLILKRYPGGVRGASFFQHNIEDAPGYMRLFERDEGARVVHYPMAANVESLLYLVNLGTIAQHCWSSRVTHPDRPDWMVFDLDPQDSPFSQVLRVAIEVREVLRRAGLECWCKTSGSKGAHIYVPLKAVYSYGQSYQFCEMACRQIAREIPELVTLERAIKKRPPGTVYLDWMQNSEAKSVAAPYSVRACPDARVSAPLDWDEVESGARGGLTPEDFTIAGIPERLKKRGDLFQSVLTLKQPLAQAQKRLEKMLNG